MDSAPLFAAAFVATVMAYFLWAFRHDGHHYFIRPMKRDAWGQRFEIVSPDNKVIGFDWYSVAKQRCAALNRASRLP